MADEAGSPQSLGSRRQFTLGAVPSLPAPGSVFVSDFVADVKRKSAQPKDFVQDRSEAAPLVWPLFRQRPDHDVSIVNNAVRVMALKGEGSA